MKHCCNYSTCNEDQNLPYAPLVRPCTKRCAHIDNFEFVKNKAVYVCIGTVWETGVGKPSAWVPWATVFSVFSKIQGKIMAKPFQSLSL